MNAHAIEMAASGDRSGESAQPRHRHADAGRDRRGDDSRQQTRARGRAAREGTHRARCRARGRCGAERRKADLRRRRHERQARRARGGRAAADIRHRPGDGAGDHGRRRGCGHSSEGRCRRRLRRRRAGDAPPPATRKDVVIGHFGERHHAVRAGCGGARARSEDPDHRRHLRPAIGAEAISPTSPSSWPWAPR